MNDCEQDGLFGVTEMGAAEAQRHEQLQDRSAVPSLKFSTEHFQKREQFDAWCDFTTTMCDLESVAPVSEGFEARASSYHLDRLLLTSFEVSPMNFTFTKEIVRKSNFDHWCLSVVTKGAVASQSETSDFKATPGKVVLHSYAVPFNGALADTNYTGLFFSRDDFWDIADALDQNKHQVLTGPLSSIVGDFVLSLNNRAESLSCNEAVAISEAFGHLLRAMVRQTPDAFEEAKAPIAAAQFDRARRYIANNLKAPNLSPEMVCADLGISRRQLYYLFERHGGVANFIRNRRLAACYNALKRDGERKLVSSIAYEFGFTNSSTFCRQFQSRYGFSPTEARSAWLSRQKTPEEDKGVLSDWLAWLSEG